MILEALSNPFQSGGRVLTWSEFVNDVLPSGQVSALSHQFCIWEQNIVLVIVFRTNLAVLQKQMFKPNIEIIDPHGGKKLKIRFNDIAGLHEAKLEIQEFVDYIKSPAKYTKLGAKLPRGALLTGPPGCGKTLLAKALAAESSVPFLSINGTEFVEMIGGLGAQRVRSLFEEAKARAPCMIFIDEIDSIGKKRTGSGFAASEENEQTLNQLLVAMDGMDSSKTVVVFGSTNRADTLDKALLRPGRFDRHILIGLPNVKEREEMFLLYLRKIKLDKEPEMYAKRLAQLTPGFSGADIYNVVNQAAIQAGSNNKSCVTIAEIDFALNRVLAGAEKRSQVMQKEEKRTVAFHEAGHVLAGWLLKHTDALLKVSIVPRTSAALGFSKYNQGDRLLFSKEEVYYTDISSYREYSFWKMQYSMKFYGMSEKIGPLSFQMDPDTEVNADFRKKPYSSTANLVSQAYYATEELLSKNREKLEIIANALLKKEVLNYEDVKKLIGPPKYGEKTVVELADQVLPKPEDMNYQI
uniref:AAA domain-containing protein n=1 Tax=Syphacia muris TaxID=451379 RepID=A0A0N5AK12_9BILA